MEVLKFCPTPKYAIIAATFAALIPIYTLAGQPIK